MGNLHMFNNYNVETFTYHLQLELCVIYDTIDVMTYFTFMILYIHITFKYDYHINNICHKHSLGP